MHTDTVARFWELVRLIGVEENDCWEWDGYVNKDGYGVFNIGNEKVLAHRFSYKLSNGEIPEGLVSDHKCRNRKCVNPSHIEPVTHAENIKRGERAQKTHCIRGHLLSGDNLRIRKNGTRFCRACDRDRAREGRGV